MCFLCCQTNLKLPLSRTCLQVQRFVRQYIGETPVGAKVVMSANIMVQKMTAVGIAPEMARRLFSQIRKGGSLRPEWRDAFLTERFTGNKGICPGAAVRSLLPVL